MNKIARLLIPAASALYATPIFALDAAGGADAARPSSAPRCLFGTLNADGVCAGAGGIFGNIANVLIFLTGAIAVLVIIFGGLRYVISTGDPGRIKQAKDTILYGVVGIVIAILAFAIVTFVTSNIK